MNALSPEQKNTLIRWMIMGQAKHPAVINDVKLVEGAHDATNAAATDVLALVWTQLCPDEWQIMIDESGVAIQEQAKATMHIALISEILSDSDVYWSMARPEDHFTK